MNGWRHHAIAALLAAAASGQDPGPEPEAPEWQSLSPADVRKLHAEGKDLIEPRFEVRADGELWMAPDHVAGDVTFGRYLPVSLSQLLRLEQYDTRTFLACSQLRWLLAPGGDLLAATDMVRHLRRSGLPTTVPEIRHLLARPSEPAASPAHELRRQLDIALLCEWLRRQNARSALPELRQLLTRELDPTTRATAERAVAALTGRPRPGTRVPISLDERLPAGTGAALLFDPTRLPPLDEFHAAMRAETLAEICRDIIQAGGSVSPSQAGGAMWMVDAPGELPFEIVRHFGPVRIDQVLLAVASHNQATVVELSGAFPPPIAEHRRDSDSDANRLVLRNGTWPSLAGGVQAADLSAAGEHALVICVADGYGVRSPMWLPLLGDATFTFDFEPRFLCTAVLRERDAAARTTLADAWRASLAALAKDHPGPLFANAKVTTADDHVRVELAADLDAKAGLALLRQLLVR